jgi:hypothetical protein
MTDDPTLKWLEQAREEAVRRLVKVRKWYDDERKAGRNPDYQRVSEATNDSWWAWVQLEHYRHTGEILGG